jgi:hypothetical protein
VRCDLDWLSPPYVAQVIVWTTVRTPGDLGASAAVREDQTDVDMSNNTASLALATPTPAPAPPTTTAPPYKPPVPPRLRGRPVVGTLLVASAPGTWRVCGTAGCRVVGRGTRLLVRRAWVGRKVTVTIERVTLRTAAVRRRG